MLVIVIDDRKDCKALEKKKLKPSSVPAMIIIIKFVG